jgi:hypothetical protein
MSNFNRINRYYSFSTRLLTIALCLGGTILPDAIGWAGVPFNPPQGGGPRGRGGASRGDSICAPKPAEFIHRFMPVTPMATNYGLTIAQHPTMFAYIPPSSAQKVFFSLKDEKGQVQYQTTLPIVTGGGIMRFELPASVPPLVVGKRYQWGIAILCNGKLKPDSPFVSSWIQRIEAPVKLLEQLNKTQSIEQATIYGKNGIWYDTLATLAEVRRKQPTDPTVLSAWSELLRSVGLQEIASEPLN